jgi:hypothetical protein
MLADKVKSFSLSVINFSHFTLVSKMLVTFKSDVFKNFKIPDKGVEALQREGLQKRVTELHPAKQQKVPQLLKRFPAF